MPNWTTNKMTIHDNDLCFIVNRHGDVDFNLLRPMPKSLDIGNVNPSSNAFALKVSRGEVSSMSQAPHDFLRRRLTYHNGETNRDYDIHNPTLYDYKAFGDLLTQNVKRYGYTNWYSWCSSEDGWGTKWNATETKLQDWKDEGYSLVEFLTAWSCPSASLLAELRTKCSRPIRFECVDEDGYGNVHDENYNDIELSDSLFHVVYQDDDSNNLTEAEYLDAKRNGKDVWKYFV